MGCGASSDAHSGPEYGQYSTFGYNSNATQNNANNQGNKKATVPSDENIYGEDIDFSDDKKRLDDLKRQQDAQDDNAQDDRPHDAAMAAALIAQQQRKEEERRKEEEERRRQEQERIEAENKRREEEQAREDNEKQEEERRRQEEDEQRQAALAATAAEEERLRQEEEEKRRQEEEEKRRQEEEEKRRQEDEQKKQEEEMKKQEEQKQQEEEQQRREAEEIAAAAAIMTQGEMEEFQTPTPPKFGTEYIKNDLDVYEKHVDFRLVAEEPECEQEPAPNDGTLYTDKDFTLQDAVPDKAGQLEWKRPTEIRSNPVLFSEGTTRFDIGQGSFGTCWFLSMVSVIADKPKLMARVIPRNAYPVGTRDYHGVFHCRFWRFGIWDDVYIDDYLPIVYGNQYFGARSATDENETWPSLLEKGFARMYGNYNSVQGGLVQDSFLNLTGGVAEMIKHEDVRDGKKMTADDLFCRLRNALHSGAVACCDVPSKFDNINGLVGGHAYSMTDALQVNENKLVRVRNPWGKTEWTGPWSDGSPQWQTIQDQVQAPNKDDGEFYMSFEHFLHYFDSVTICSLTPDFDQDGDKSDGLNYAASIYGQWKGEEAAGFQKKIQNPKYSFRVGNDAVDEGGKVPIVVQIIQRTKKRKSNHPSIRCDLYKVLNRDSNDQMVVMALGKDRGTYRSDMQVCYRFLVSPGEYCCVPSTIEEGIEKEFMIRVFTCGPISDIRYIENDITIQEITETPDPSLECSQCLVGQWISGKNAGGQVSKQTFSTNPQFHIDVPNHGGDVSVSFMLSQEAVEPRYPIGFKLFPRDGTSIPVSQDWLYEHWDKPISTTEGDDSVFIIANCTPEQKYRLPPGEYVAIIHADSEDQEKRFALTVFSDKRIDVTGHQLS